MYKKIAVLRTDSRTGASTSLSELKPTNGRQCQSPTGSHKGIRLYLTHVCGAGVQTGAHPIDWITLHQQRGDNLTFIFTSASVSNSRARGIPGWAPTLWLQGEMSPSTSRC